MTQKDLDAIMGCIDRIAGSKAYESSLNQLTDALCRIAEKPISIKGLEKICTSIDALCSKIECLAEKGQRRSHS